MYLNHDDPHWEVIFNVFLSNMVQYLAFFQTFFLIVSTATNGEFPHVHPYILQSKIWPHPWYHINPWTPPPSEPLKKCLITALQAIKSAPKYAFSGHLDIHPHAPPFRPQGHCSALTPLLRLITIRVISGETNQIIKPSNHRFCLFLVYRCTLGSN